MYHFNIVNWTFLLQFVSFTVRCCSKGVASNSLQCTSCHKWVHKKCNAIKGSTSKVMKSFTCRGCLNLVTSAGRANVNTGASAKLELVISFVT